MRLIGSFLFLIAALSVGAYAYFPSHEFHAFGLDRLLQTDPSKPRLATHEGPAAADTAVAERSFSPGPSVFRSFVEAMTRRTESAADRAPARDGAVDLQHDIAVNPSPDEPVATPGVPDRTWRALASNETGDARRAAAKTSDYMARYELARSLQTELTRVGCYHADVDGDWGPGSKRAAADFLRKVNATLPIDRPDHILLTLIQGHADKACGVDCPDGKSLGSNGRCVSNVIVARGPERGTLLSQKTLGKDHATTRWTATTSVANTDSNVPPPERARAVSGTSRVSVAQASRATLPSEATSTAGTATVTFAQANRAKPLPGMMAVGGPLPSNEEVAVAPITSTVTVAPMPARAPAAIALPRPEPSPALPGVSETASIDQNAAGLSSLDPPSANQALAPNRHRPTATRSSSSRTGASHRSQASESSRRWRKSDTVRTPQGKVRRGSPQHNLMLSLGGVF